MADITQASSSQADENFHAFLSKLPDLMTTHAGKVAVLHDREIVEFFDSYADAVRFGQAKYGDIGNFSLQEVTNHVSSLGFYGHAISDLH